MEIFHEMSQLEKARTLPNLDLSQSKRLILKHCIESLRERIQTHGKALGEPYVLEMSGWRLRKQTESVPL